MWNNRDEREWNPVNNSISINSLPISQTILSITIAIKYLCSPLLNFLMLCGFGLEVTGPLCVRALLRKSRKNFCREEVWTLGFPLHSQLMQGHYWRQVYFNRKYFVMHCGKFDGITPVKMK